SKVFQAALLEQGIPFTAFEVDDVDAEFERLTKMGVVFTKDPMDAGGTRFAILSDTCGNLIQLYKPPE
ncbi:MAG: VOC family protein, partial [Myxococcota bacterium]